MGIRKPSPPIHEIRYDMLQLLLNSMFSAFPGIWTEPKKDDLSAPIPEAQGKSECAPVVEVKQDSITADIKRLEAEYGPFEEGMELTVELKRLLVLCNRSRRRKDAYKKLQKELLREKGVILTIKSQKG